MLKEMMVAGAMAMAPGAALAAGGGEEEGIKKVIEAFAGGGDRRDVKALEVLLDPHFRILYARPGDARVSVMMRAEYLGLLSAGKIGGVPRTVEVQGTVIKGLLAFAQVKMVSREMRFDSTFTLVKDGGAWKVIEDSTIVHAQ